MERLKELRLKLGLRQCEIANLLGIKQGAYSAIEVGRNSLTPRNVELLNSKLNVNVDWLLNGQGEMFKNASENSETTDNIRLPQVPEIDKKELSSASPLLDIIKSQGEALKEIALNRDSKYIEEITLIKKEIEALKEIFKNQSAEFRTLCDKLDKLISANNISGQKKVV